ncbi:MAG: Maf family protein [Alphaproteobacteria bacterium]|nr:Maf family protein [Alphaproteobacteria bacterium]
MSAGKEKTRLILASQSRARQEMLHAAGLVFESIPAQIDEEALTRKWQGEGVAAQDIAEKLAEEKAVYIARTNPGALVIGADQVLECGGVLLSKALDAGEAREKLRALRGKTHHLISAFTLVRDGEILCAETQSARLTMRDFDEGFLESYCQKAGDALTKNVGAYALEGPGVHLFEKIEGDYFTILGLPLLPLLKQLRTHHNIDLEGGCA